VKEDIARHDRFGRVRSLALLASCIVAAGSVSLLLGQDVNWDLKNYHFYVPYAFLNGRLGWDVAPAQVQSYLNPIVDLPFYFFATAIPSARVVAFLMAASTGVAVFFLVRILLSSFRTSDRRDGWVRFAAALAIGVTGAAGVSTIGSTMSEWPSVAMLLAAIYVVLRSDTVSRARLFAAGALMGAGAGLKPTYVIYGAAFFVAIFALIPKGSRVRDAAIYSGAALLGFAATTGFWCATLQRQLGSPVFPILNGIVKSPFWEPISLRDVRFLPRTLGQAIAYPFLFARKSRCAFRPGDPLRREVDGEAARTSPGRNDRRRTPATALPDRLQRRRVRRVVGFVRYLSVSRPARSPLGSLDRVRGRLPRWKRCDVAVRGAGRGGGDRELDASHELGKEAVRRRLLPSVGARAVAEGSRRHRGLESRFN
jgi:hypothetical protein